MRMPSVGKRAAFFCLHEVDFGHHDLQWICTCSFCIACDFSLQVDLATSGLAPYLTYENGISRFEQSPEVSCSNSLPMFLNTFVFNVAEMTKTQKCYNLE